MSIIKIFVSFGLLPLALNLAFSIQNASALSEKDIRVIKISGSDATAVVRLQGGDLQIIRVGDDLSDIGKVVNIAAGRIVIHRTSDEGLEKIIIRLDAEGQKIQRITSDQKTPTRLYEPKTVEGSN